MSVRIFVVDDSKLARIILTRAIHAVEPDWVCLKASSAEGAFALLDSEQAHVSIVDCNMPGMNGLEASREIRSRYPEMPIAIVTANVQTDILSGARALSANLIAKPVSADGLEPFLWEARRRLFSA